MKRRTILTAAGASALAGFAAAQSYPSRPIKYICPWPAGGSTDVVMRSLAESAGKALGQTVVVENKPGAGGMLGAIDMLNARPDGYTLCQIPHGAFRIPHMQKVAFDTLRDFTWIACLTGYTFGMVVQADSPFKSIKDVVDYARANPGKFSYGSTGTGTSPHLAVEEFALKAGVSLNHVPFKGNADNMQALLGGHVMAASDATGWGPHVDAGRLRLLRQRALQGRRKRLMRRAVVGRGRCASRALHRGLPLHLRGGHRREGRGRGLRLPGNTATGCLWHDRQAAGLVLQGLHQNLLGVPPGRKSSLPLLRVVVGIDHQ